MRSWRLPELSPKNATPIKFERRYYSMVAKNVIACSALVFLASCASTPSSPSDSYEAVHQADGSIALSVTAKSERLASSSGSFSIGLTDLLEKAAAEECAGRFDLT